MRWGRRKRQISPDQVQEVKKEKQLSFLTCLLAMLLCNACSVVEESNQQPAKPQDQETQLETTQHPESAPQPQARSVQRNFDIIRRSKNRYVQPSRKGPAVIYGLDPLVQTRRSRHMKTAKIDEKDLEGFAVAKKSSDPENDFRESMVRMIRLKRIGRPEDLENLLACYLVLNSDEYHDVIVKVFRQVWIEVSSARLRASRRPVRPNRHR